MSDLIGPKGMKFIDEMLLKSVVMLIASIKEHILLNRELLERISTQWSDEAKCNEALKKLKSKNKEFSGFEFFGIRCQGNLSKNNIIWNYYRVQKDATWCNTTRKRIQYILLIKQNLDILNPLSKIHKPTYTSPQYILHRYNRSIHLQSIPIKSFKKSYFI